MLLEISIQLVFSHFCFLFIVVLLIFVLILIAVISFSWLFFIFNLLKYSFFIFSFISTCMIVLVPMFPSTCKFPFPYAFWCFLDLVVLFLPMSSLRCNTLCIIINFLVLWSICLSSPLVYFQNVLSILHGGQSRCLSFW